MKKIILATIALILIIAGVGFYMWNKPHEDMAAANADVTISANELLAAFQTDENASNTKYNDKIVEISGQVRSANTDGGKTIVTLDAGDSMAAVTCELDDFTKHKRTDFSTGEQVTFKCTCTGILMDVVLVRCVEK